MRRHRLVALLSLLPSLATLPLATLPLAALPLATLPLLSLSAHAAPSTTSSIEIVFLPEPSAASPLVIMLENSGSRRAITWGFGGGAASSGTLADEAGNPRALTPLPMAPRGATLLDRGGSISIAIDDAGEWQETLKVIPPAKGTGALPVAGARGLRLVVHGGVDGPPTTATLYGADVRIAGRAIVRTDRPRLRAVVLAGNDLIGAEATAVTEAPACGRPAPTAASVVAEASLQLFASGPALCVGALVLVPVSGKKLDVRADLPAAGILVLR
jgi:hypothetical protein